MESPPSLRRAALELSAASCAVLLQELTLIRWLGGQVRVLAYFPNLILLSAFLGLGLGCLRAGKRSLLWMWPAALVLLAAAAVALGRVVFTQESVSEHLWLLYFDMPAGAPVVNGVRLPILLSFVLGAISFVPLGQDVAERLVVFSRASSSLRGYVWDLCGSLAGVAVFSLLGWAGTPPAAWFAALAAAGVPLVAPRRRLLLAWAAACAALLVLAVRSDRAEVYSPYYALSTSVNENGAVLVLVNGSLHQVALDLRRSAPAGVEYRDAVSRGFHTPYAVLGRPVRNALVLGAGTGNDVAVLLDEGAGHVDAVEIDPEIIKAGRRLHPDHPYDSPRVTVFNTDARSFLNGTRASYDLIVFGTLDSMTRLSALSNVRLDNFVYTLESLRAARSRLAPDGGVVLYFMVTTSYIRDRLFALLTETFDEAPLMVSGNSRLFNHVFMAGPAFAGRDAEKRRGLKSLYEEKFRRETVLPTDDWPFLYLKEPAVSGFYLSMMAAIFSLSLAGTLLCSPEMRRGLSGRGPVDVPMFLMGAAFLLLETRSVTAMNLAWGATWVTSAVVFGAILTTVLLATLLASRRAFRWEASLACLLASLAAAFLAPGHLFLSTGLAARLGLSFLAVGLPLFFASLLFAAVFSGRSEAGTSFGWNLLGAAAGGLMEFLSMSLGLRALLLLAAALYLGVGWSLVRAPGRLSTAGAGAAA